MKAIQVLFHQIYFLANISFILCQTFFSLLCSLEKFYKPNKLLQCRIIDYFLLIKSTAQAAALDIGITSKKFRVTDILKETNVVAILGNVSNDFIIVVSC